MLASLALALITALPPATCAGAPGPLATPFSVADTSLVALYDAGATFESFLAAADDRKAQWERHWRESVVPPDALATARALTGRWRLLVVAVDGCSDSVNTIPFLARLVTEVPALELRIVTPEQGRAVMEGHRTPDGRAATPTVLILAPDGREAGCWVERPSALQAMAIKAREEGRSEEFGRDKQGWYDRDAGASTIREVVAALIAAADGRPHCESRR